VIRSDRGIYIVDFGVSGVYPRIQELAMLLCDLFFTPDKAEYTKNYQLALDAYQETVQLEDTELEWLPTFVKLAHAMHIIAPTIQKVKHGNSSAENEHWLRRGREGLRFMGKFTKVRV
jgi:Ser/Thr protein kinase RdoA (MazF antagonist)